MQEYQITYKEKKILMVLELASNLIEYKAPNPDTAIRKLSTYNLQEALEDFTSSGFDTIILQDFIQQQGV